MPCLSVGVLPVGASFMFAHMDQSNLLNRVASVDISAIFVFIFRLSPHMYDFIACFTFKKSHKINISM